ncbi:bpX6 domain-containing protein [Kitasatospora sp. NPDC059408]|uniref:bpX6 domain-containing protein n=1 Tax=Kitasatospora sp. NPDC059408 TaxID=3346823 RepID=UPI0036A5DE00
MSPVIHASGFVLDAPVIGAAEAADRVLTAWRPGAELRELPDGRWLFTLPEPTPIRVDGAPGEPLRAVGGGLEAVGLRGDENAAPGELLLHAAGVIERHIINSLPQLRPEDWLDLSGLTLHRLGVVGAPVVPETVREDVPQAPGVDLRTAAGISESTDRARRRTAPGPDRSNEGWVAAAAVFLVAAIAAIPFSNLIARRGFHLGAFLLAVGGAAAVLLGFVLHDRRQARSAGAAHAAAGGAAARSTARPRGARRTPSTSGALHRRHLRYLRDLTRAFEQRRWEDALRDAIRLAAAGSRDQPVWFGRRLPRRFTGALRPTPRLADGPLVASPISGPTVHQYLTDLYREAARALEGEGRIDEAAFVLADLLDAPAEAVALLARRDRAAQAAELAEGRRLAAHLIVRLWWRAGDRDRAVRTAHRRGAFARAVERLADTDRAAARDLRTAWVEHCRSRGDRLGAVAAAWPDPVLRPTVAADLRDAVALGGPVRGRALAHLLALGAGDATRRLARALLDGGDEAAGSLALAAALADLPAADPAVDRELTTAALRAVIRAGGFGRPDGTRDAHTEHLLHERLLKRADPFAAVDLPRLRRAERSVAGVPHLTAPDRPGTLPVLDAVRLGSGSVLVACGHAGVRLLAPDGRTRARWDVPADQLVVADHGGTALLVAHYGDVHELVRLDLATRTLHRWTTLRTRQIVPSFDGRHLLTADDDGITVLDTHTPRPTVVWRELGHDQRLSGPVVRSATSCAALVRTRSDGRTPGRAELWRWDQPGWELRRRLGLEEDDRVAAQPLANGRLLSVGPGALRWTGESGSVSLEVDGEGEARTDGAWWAYTATDATGAHVRAGAGSGATPAFTARFPGAAGTPVGIRHHAGAVTLWHRSGRVLAVTPDGGTLLAGLRVTAS